jgi:iron complex outermembrane receptor protein
MWKKIILPVFITATFFAQNRDTVKTYSTNEIVVQSSLVLKPQSLIEVDAKEIELSDAQTIKDIAIILPSVKGQSNSRGESYFYLRNCGNRQLQLMFDGVPTNLPWDGRFDLSLLPTNAVTSVTINKGIPSVIYGANTLGGVINVGTMELRDKSYFDFRSLFGANNFKDVSITTASGNSDYSYVVSGKYYGSDGFDLPSDFSNAENPGETRLNSYSSGLNLFARGTKYYGKNSNVGVSFSYYKGDKGVPPEIGAKKIRYWKYPEISRFSATVNGSHYFSVDGKTFLTYAVNYTNYHSLIDQYTDATYSELDATEDGKDNTLYGRLIFTNIFSETSLLNFSASGFSSKHYENIAENENGELAALPENIYEQRVFSVGAEYQYVKPKYNFTFGASYDGALTPETGNNPDKDPIFDYGLNASFVYAFADNLYARINYGRKTRFPSMREMYSEALGKFKINPDLKAEKVNGGEIGISYDAQMFSVEADLFANYIADGIVRKRLPPEDPHKYMRVNKSEIRNVGIETEIKFNLIKNFDAGVNFAYIDSKGKNDAGEFSDTLEYKPQIIAGLFLSYNIGDAQFVAEGKYIGKEYGLEDYYTELPDYFLLNFRASYFVRFAANYKAELILRVNNVFDELYYTQLGLPEAGRQIRMGCNIYFTR